MKLSSYVKEGSFIHNYMLHMMEMETPSSYDFWSAMWLLSNAVGRDCYVNRPRVPVRFNLYIILCADSGVTRKSTSVSYPSCIIHHLHRPGLLRIDSKIYPAKLLSDAAEVSATYDRCHIAFSISELTSVLSKTGYMRDMPVILTDLYDSPSHRSGGGSISLGGGELRNVYVTFLAATAPRWLATRANSDIIEGGFTSRTLFIHEETRKRKISWPQAGQVSDEDFIKERGDELNEIADRARRVGRVELKEEAIKLYSRWYDRRDEGETSFTRSFASREADHVLRIAGLLAINDAHWVISDYHVKRAITIVRRIRDSASNLFETLFSSDRDAKAGDNLVRGCEVLKEFLVSQGTNATPHSILLRKAQPLKSVVISKILDYMEDRKMVRRIVQKGGKGRPSTYWLGTRLLLEVPMMEVVKALDGSRV